MFSTLNALAMLRNSTLFPAMINTVALMVGVFYAWKMAASRAEGEWRQYLLKVGGMVILINALLLPTTSMNIKDHVEKHFWRVDNIPLAFALPIGIVEEIGHLLTIGFEQAFSAVDGRSAFNYYHHGTVFGARLSKEVLQAHLRHPEFVANMNSFIKRCVVLPAMIGHQFTKEELVATKDMWGLVSTKAGTFTRVPMIIGGTRQEPSPTCKQAVPYFDRKMKDSAVTDITAISIKLRAPGAGVEYNPSHLGMNEALKGQIEALYNDETSVETILKHNMMINSLNQYRSGKYPMAKAQLQHEAGGLISGDMAERILTGFLTVIKNLIYGSFVFVVPLMLFAGGMQSYRGWITVCLSLQLWPPLFAMLNMMIDTAYEPAHIVSYSSWSTAVKQMDSIASVAANLTLLIPFLAIYVTRMSEGGFLHLAGSIMATAQSAGGAAAAEQSSGGKSYDNQSIANRNRSNVSENKYDDARQFVTGTNSGITSDGSMEKVLPNGQMITMGGAGATSSSGEASYHTEEAVQGGLSEHYAQTQSIAQTDQRMWNESKSNSTSKAANYLTNIAEHIKKNEGFSVDTSTEEGKSVNQAIEAIEAETSSNGKSFQQNAEAFISGSASFSTPLKGITGVGASGEIGGKASALNSSNQSLDSENKVSGTNRTDESRGNVIRALSSDSWAKEHGMDQSLSTDVRKSYDETQRLEKQYTAHREDMENAGEALNYSKTHGVTSSKDMYQEVLDTYAKKSGKSIADARIDVENRTPEVRRIFNSLAGAEASGILDSVTAMRQQLLGSEVTTKKLDDFTDSHQDKITQNVETDVHQVAKVQGFKPQSIKENISNAGTSYKEKFENMQTKTEDQYAGISQANKLQQKDMKAESARYEENRLGAGKILTLGGMTDGLGRPKESLLNSANSKPAYSNIEKESPSLKMPEFKPMVRDVNTGRFVDEVGSTGDGQKVDPSIIKQNKN